MNYSFFAQVDVDNTVDNPVVESVKLGSGVLRNVKILFPSGCNGTVRCCLVNDGYQLLPTNQNGYYDLDGDFVDASLWYDLQANPNQLWLVCWSVNAGYSHTIRILLDVKEDSEPDPWATQEKIVELMNRIVTLVKGYL